ncbi:hypothetical protein EDB81DRAFT_691592 [Dactylonectria macrodidyma]|uniref:Uncharacterized protein n=1 Tax=Dactylonectria macrodidyma TaxID=307937 RepID=A0A9P9ERX5_9HYPO|nr:hypothetical protein EDB81DRAFT_691592 [Dactylonectria macrodidyma]
MDNTFFFVDGIEPDRESKRLMRRHVMKGKNAGKTFHRRSRPGLASRQSNTTLAPSSSSLYLSRHLDKQTSRWDWGCLPTNAIGRNLGSVLFTCSLPVKVTTTSQKIIHQFFNFTADRIYPVRLGISLDDAKYMWLRVLFSDEATYQCNISLMAASNEVFLGGGDSSPKAFYHLSRTLSLVQKRLERPDALSDSTIGIVLSLISHESIRQEHASAKVHVDGLRRMVELRGGLSQLEGNIPLLLKVCKTDIIFAIQHGGPTIFFRDSMPQVQVLLSSKGLSLDRASAASSVQHGGLEPYLHEILLDVISTSSLFNNKLHMHSVGLVAFQEMLVSICYRLLRLHPLDEPRQASDIQTVYHIGLTIFMMTLFLQYNRHQIMDHKLVSFCFKDVLVRGSFEHESELMLWFMFIGGIWVSGDVDTYWVVPRIRATLQQLGIKTWDEAQSSLRKFPWINVLHDQPGRELWDRTDQVYEIP